MSAEKSDNDHDWQTADDVPWTLLDDTDELANAYWAVVAPALRADGHDPETYQPSHQWLRDNGFRSLLYALREYHDRTFSQFWNEDLDLQDGDGPNWSTDHDRTAEALDAYLASKRERAQLAESSIRTPSIVSTGTSAPIGRSTRPTTS